MSLTQRSSKQITFRNRSFMVFFIWIVSSNIVKIVFQIFLLRGRVRINALFSTCNLVHNHRCIIMFCCLWRILKRQNIQQMTSSHFLETKGLKVPGNREVSEAFQKYFRCKCYLPRTLALMFRSVDSLPS